MATSVAAPPPPPPPQSSSSSSSASYGGSGGMNGLSAQMGALTVASSPSLINWVPLDLWRASNLAQEAEDVGARWKAVNARGNVDDIAALRASIERRIDDLEAFYVEHADDGRAVLFDKQRLKLRKLLHESAAASAATAVTDSVSEDAPLTLQRLITWFLNSGQREVPGLTEAAIQKLFAAHAARTRLDRMSIRTLKANFGATGGSGSSGAFAGGGASNASAVGPGSVMSGGGAGTATTQTVVSPRLTVATSSSASKTAKAPTRSPVKKPTNASAATPSSARKPAATPGKQKATPVKPIYAWEKAGVEDETKDEVPLPLDGVLDFQIKMTAEEYAALACQRRAMIAERKHKQRAAAVALPSTEPVSQNLSTPYVEPYTLETALHRTPQKDRWLTETGFHAAPQTATPKRKA